jgi:hypothetical protein
MYLICAIHLMFAQPASERIPFTLTENFRGEVLNQDDSWYYMDFSNDEEAKEVLPINDLKQWVSKERCWTP